LTDSLVVAFSKLDDLLMDDQQDKHTGRNQKQYEVVHFRDCGSGISGSKQVFQGNSLPPDQLRQNRYSSDAERAVQPAQVFAKKVAEQAKHTQQGSEKKRGAHDSADDYQRCGREEWINTTNQRDNQQNNESESHGLP
jgi:hypothetical protein